MTPSGESDLIVTGPLRAQMYWLVAAVLPAECEDDERKKLTEGEASALFVLMRRVIRVNTAAAPPICWTLAMGWAGR